MAADQGKSDPLICVSLFCRFYVVALWGHYLTVVDVLFNFHTTIVKFHMESSGGRRNKIDGCDYKHKRLQIYVKLFFHNLKVYVYQCVLICIITNLIWVCCIILFWKEVFGQSFLNVAYLHWIICSNPSFPFWGV